MRELKADKTFVFGEECEAYKKSEADKVIAELKETLNNSRNARKYWRKEYLIEYKESIHHKYKRCLTLARLCHSKDCTMLHEASDSGTFFKESWFWKRALWYGKWHRKWLELAKKFKDGV